MRTKRAQTEWLEGAFFVELGDGLDGGVGLGVTPIMATIRAGTATGPAAAADAIRVALESPKHTTDPAALTAQ